MKTPYKKPNPGDKVEVIVNNEKQEGILLDSHDRGVFCLNYPQDIIFG